MAEATSIPIPSPYAWDASFDVKVASFNTQHKKLFDLINALDADRGNGGKLKALVEYVVMHFKSEEDSFAQHGFDSASTKGHKAIHEKFVSDAGGVKVPVDEGTMNFIKQWLVNHIKISDMKYADFLSGKGCA